MRRRREVRQSGVVRTAAGPDASNLPPAGPDHCCRVRRLRERSKRSTTSTSPPATCSTPNRFRNRTRTTTRAASETRPTVRSQSSSRAAYPSAARGPSLFRCARCAADSAEPVRPRRRGQRRAGADRAMDLRELLRGRPRGAAAARAGERRGPGGQARSNYDGPSSERSLPSHAPLAHAWRRAIPILVSHDLVAMCVDTVVWSSGASRFLADAGDFRWSYR